MARYVRGPDRWEIIERGTTLAIIAGTAKEVVRRFTTPLAVRAMRDKLVADKLAEGFALVDEGDAPVDSVEPGEASRFYPRNLELEAAIADDPYDASGYVVYGDWMERHGDPRGALIALMAADKEAAVDAALRADRADFFGPLARGRTVPRHDDSRYRWRFGFIDRVALERERDGQDIAQRLATVLEHPSGRFVTEVSVGSDDEHDLHETLAVLVRLRPRCLRALEILSRTAIGDLAHLWPAVPALRHLAVKIRSRRKQSPGLAPAAVRSVATAPLPMLERLELRVGTGPAAMTSLAPLLARRDLPRLTHLRVRDVRFAREVLTMLAGAPFAAQLVVINLGLGELDDEAARQFVVARDRFPALTELWVTRGLVSPLAHGLLAGCVKHVVELSREPADATLEALSKARFRSSGE